VAPGDREESTFRFAYQTDVQSLDPHALSETFTLGFLGNVYEGLVAYGPNLEVMPALAESWETKNPTTWVFKLRRGVTFHNGNRFTADDVVFTWERALGEGSDMKLWAGKMKNVRKVDDHTVEVDTEAPNPILPRDFIFLYMMDKEWAEANGAAAYSNADLKATPLAGSLTG
jgi:peptide/nickel transport system substrate-binding protein